MATRVKLNHSGFDALLRDPKLAAAVRDEAEKIQARAGKNFSVDLHVTNRARASIFPNSFQGVLDEARRGKLSQALGGGGG